MQDKTKDQKVRIRLGGGRWGKALSQERLKQKSCSGQKFFDEKEEKERSEFSSKNYQKQQDCQTVIKEKKTKSVDRNIIPADQKFELQQLIILAGLPIAVFILIWIIYSQYIAISSTL